MRVFLGVDPGVSGGIAAIGDNGFAVAHAMPREEFEIDALFRSFVDGELRAEFALIEAVHAMPVERVDRRTGKVIKQGATSIFTFGQGYGFLRGLLVAHRIPFDQMHPRTWQKRLLIQPREKNETQPEFKRRLRCKAQQLYPHLSITLSTGDAVLLAHVARFYMLRPPDSAQAALTLEGAGIGR